MVTRHEDERRRRDYGWVVGSRNLGMFRFREEEAVRTSTVLVASSVSSTD